MTKEAQGQNLPPASRLVQILADASSNKAHLVCDLVEHTLRSIFKLGLWNRKTWSEFEKTPKFLEVLQDLVLHDTRPHFRGLVVRLVDEFIMLEVQMPPPDMTKHATYGRLTDFFWSLMLQSFPQTVDYPQQCLEFFTLCQWTMPRLLGVSPKAAKASFADVAKQLSRLLLEHTPIEVSTKGKYVVGRKDAELH